MRLFYGRQRSQWRLVELIGVREGFRGEQFAHSMRFPSDQITRPEVDEIALDARNQSVNSTGVDMLVLRCENDAVLVRPRPLNRDVEILAVPIEALEQNGITVK